MLVGFPPLLPWPAATDLKPRNACVQLIAAGRGPSTSNDTVWMLRLVGTAPSALPRCAARRRHRHPQVHRDLKPQNVLLKSSPGDVRGFTAKARRGRWAWAVV